MTSLATLAHGAPAPAPFNANFYTVAATVIPVLYLAIAVQGRGVEDLIKLSIRATLWTVSDPRKSELRQQAANSLAGIPAVIAVLILLAGADAEVLAIVALYQQHAIGGTGFYVLTGAIFLTLTAIMPPTMTIIQALEQARRDNQPAAAGNADEKTPASSPALQPSKTDPED